jgi:hypothetical protein
MYTLTQNPDIVVRDADQANIPRDEGNRDYQEYLQWLAEGNTPAPYEPPPAGG